MESWFHNIWFRRIWPIVLIAAILFGYNYYSKQQAALEVRRENQVALVTAKLWVASALYRHEPERYEQVRDSVLTATGLKQEHIELYMERYTSADINPAAFAEKVKFKIDSLVRLEVGEDSSWMEYQLPGDSQ
jgi:hypothetical protein